MIDWDNIDAIVDRIEESFLDDHKREIQTAYDSVLEIYSELYKSTKAVDESLDPGDWTGLYEELKKILDVFVSEFNVKRNHI